MAENLTLYAKFTENAAVTGVTLNTNALSLTAGGSADLISFIAPANATNQNVTWTSSDESVASVNGGTVTALKAGTATITVTTEDGGFNATCVVTVSASATGGGSLDTLTGKGCVIRDGKLVLYVADMPEAGAIIGYQRVYTDEAAANAAVLGDLPGVFMTKNGDVWELECDIPASGTYLAYAFNLAQWDIPRVITADDIPNMDETPSTPETPAVTGVTGVTLNSTSATLTEEETITLTASIAPENADNKMIYWSTSDERVATVDATGKVTATGAGQAKIIVTTEDGGKTAICNITVTAKETGGNGDGTGQTPGTGNGGGTSQTPGTGGNGGGTGQTPGTGNGDGTSQTPETGGNGGGTSQTPETGGNGGGTGQTPGTGGNGGGTGQTPGTGDNGDGTGQSPENGTQEPITEIIEGESDVTQVTELIAGTDTDTGDVAGATFGKLQLKATGKSKSVKLTWKKVKDADGYILYGAQCGKSMKEIKSFTGAKKVSYTQKKLKKGKFYKYMLIAYKEVDDRKVVVASSKTVHVTTTGGKYGNPSKVTVKPASVTLKKGKKKTLKASYKATKKNVKNHISKFRYESNNTKVATVTKKGVVKGIKKGTAYIYVYTQNGVCKKIKVKVR